MPGYFFMNIFTGLEGLCSHIYIGIFLTYSKIYIRGFFCTYFFRNPSNLMANLEFFKLFFKECIPGFFTIFQQYCFSILVGLHSIFFLFSTLNMFFLFFKHSLELNQGFVFEYLFKHCRHDFFSTVRLKLSSVPINSIVIFEDFILRP